MRWQLTFGWRMGLAYARSATKQAQGRLTKGRDRSPHSSLLFLWPSASVFLFSPSKNSCTGQHEALLFGWDLLCFFLHPEANSQWGSRANTDVREGIRMTNAIRILFLTSREVVSIPSTVWGVRGPARLRSEPAEILIAPLFMNAGQHDVVTLAYFITDQTLVGRCYKLVTVSSTELRGMSADALFCMTFSVCCAHVVVLRLTLHVLTMCFGSTIILSIQT